LRETVLATFKQRAQSFFIKTKKTKAGFFLKSMERQCHSEGSTT
jgi:hypothetical protein